MIAAFPKGAHAQQARKLHRIAILWHAGNAEEEGPYLEAVRLGFIDHGYVEGRTITFEHRFPNEEPERFRSMAAELAALQPDVFLTAGGPASIAAKNATATIPVVFIVVPDPLGSNLVDSLARPGANVTGLANFAVQLSAKRLEFLKEAVPRLSRVALLINPNVKITSRYVEESEPAAAKLGVALQRIEARSIQLGRLAGLEMFGTCSSRGASTVSDLGGTPIDYRPLDFVEEIRCLIGEGVDAVFDSFGGTHIWRSCKALRPGGTVVAYGLTASLREGRLASGRSGRRHRFRAIAIFGLYIAGGWLLPGRRRVVPYSIQWLKRLRPALFRQDLIALFDLLQQQKIKPLVARRFPIAEARQAHELLGRVGVTGKIVLVRTA